MVERRLPSPEILTQESTFIEMLENQWQAENFVCVGLDYNHDMLPKIFSDLRTEEAIFEFNKAIIDATAGSVCAYKPNLSSYEKLDIPGLVGLKRTMHYIKDTYPTIPVILDSKRGDIHHSNENYAISDFDVRRADAITVHPYIGGNSLEPFIGRKNKGVIIMGANSDDGAGELQDQPTGELQEPGYQFVARKVATEWNRNGNCLLTAGAKEPHKIARIREIVGDMPLLILGIGAQGGELQATINAGMDSRGEGMIINSTRAIIYASSGKDFQFAAWKATHDLRDAINETRN